MNDSTDKRGFAPLIYPGRLWALSLIVSSLWYTSAVQAQQPSAPPPIIPTALGVVSPPSVPGDTLSGDLRLDAKVTLTHRSVTVEEALRELTNLTKVRLAAAGNEAPSWQIALAVKDEPLRDVLRALAAVNNCHWKRVRAADGRDALTLMDISDDPRYWDFLRPKTQAEADLHLGVEDFQKDFAQLPPDAQKAFAAGGPGVGYGNLSPTMQQGVRQAFLAHLQMLAARHSNMPMNADSLSSMNVTLVTHPQDGMVQYVVHLAGPLVQMGDGGGVELSADLSASVPDDPHALNETVLPSGYLPWQSKQPQVTSDWFDASHAKALTGDLRLSRPVSIKTEDTMLGFALAALADAAHVNVVAQVFPGRHTISLASVSLKDALDKITGKYQAMWGEAADGTILVHYNEYPHQASQQTAAK